MLHTSMFPILSKMGRNAMKNIMQKRQQRVLKRKLKNTQRTLDTIHNSSPNIFMSIIFIFSPMLKLQIIFHSIASSISIIEYSSNNEEQQSCSSKTVFKNLAFSDSWASSLCTPPRPPRPWWCCWWPRWRGRRPRGTPRTCTTRRGPGRCRSTFWPPARVQCQSPWEQLTRSPINKHEDRLTGTSEKLSNKPERTRLYFICLS